MRSQFTLILLLLVSAALAHEGGTYHKYFGEVKINSQTAPELTEIKAVTSSGFEQEANVRAGKYFLEFEDLPDGETIDFYMKNVKVATVTAGPEETELDLQLDEPQQGIAAMQFIPFALAAFLAIGMFLMRKSLGKVQLVALGLVVTGLVIFGALSFGAAPVQKDDPLVLTGETKTFDIVAKQWVFEPSEIRVKRGDKVVLNITSGDVPHGLALTKYNILMSAEPGKYDAVEFIAKDSGELTFFCSVDCGEGHTVMKGKIIIE